MLLLSLMSSIRQALRQAQEVLRTGFEAEGREIPRAQQPKAAGLDKIYGQSLLLPATYGVKVRYGGFLPAVEMTLLASCGCLSSYSRFIAFIFRAGWSGKRRSARKASDRESARPPR